MFVFIGTGYLTAVAIIHELIPRMDRGRFGERVEGHFWKNTNKRNR